MKTSWPRALFIFISPVLFFILVRWLIVEPFVIPSGSMIPTLLINENILVNKAAFGIRNPFVNNFLVRWASPRRNEIVVFRYPENPEVFYVKRIIGIPGDEVSFHGNELRINGQLAPLEPAKSPLATPTSSSGERQYQYFRENQHLVRYHVFEGPDEKLHVPAGQYFVMGDNRDESSDSRMWGLVPEENLIGHVILILLSTEYSFFQDSASQALSTIRWSRLLRVP